MASSSGATGDDKPPLTASAIVVPVESGSHILRIDGYSYSKALRKAECTALASEVFVVGGHCWRLQYYPDGEHSETTGWISFALELVHVFRGNSDDFEVQAKFTIGLLDQDGNPVPTYTINTVICTFCDMQSSIRPKFIRRSDLEGSAYLKDDVFAVRCDVTVLKKALTKAIPVSEVLRGVVRKES